MDMGGGSMGGGDGSGGTSAACKINMLWNWYTVDACFVSTQWHIRSKGAFAATVICVFILVALVECVRRASRDYDRWISVQNARLAGGSPSASLLQYPDAKNRGNQPAVSPARFPTWHQQFVRGGFFFVQFGAAYMLMLLAMYFNGFIIFAIILGGTAGHIMFAADTVVGSPTTGGAAHGETGAACC
ncbi:Ctr copper transporter [Clavulina sp. PMI_390]|nr:Ctr copper transporter [Clavulina sp. PMI_390]